MLVWVLQTGKWINPFDDSPVELEPDKTTVYLPDGLKARGIKFTLLRESLNKKICLEFIVTVE